MLGAVIVCKGLAPAAGSLQSDDDDRRAERGGRGDLKGILTLLPEKVKVFVAVLCEYIRQAFGGLIRFGTARSSAGDQRVFNPSEHDAKQAYQNKPATAPDCF